MRHFAHHIGDYAAATAHLSFVEDAAYHRLLRLYYRDESPLPIDVGACQRLAGARSKEERAAIERMLREFFTLEDNGWHQTRADDEIAGYRLRADAARENGHRGGRPRTKRKPKDNQGGLQNEPNEKLTTNQEPLTKSEAKASEETDDGPRTKLPAGWQPSPDSRDHAADKGLDPAIVVEAFTDWFEGGRGRNEKRTAAGWDKRFRVWCNTDATRSVGRQAPRAVRPARGNDAVFEHLVDIANRGGGSGPNDPGG